MSGPFQRLADGLRAGWRNFTRPPRILTACGLFEALAAEAAHVAQSATYAYLRARAGFMGPRLFTEKPFLEALEVTRWEALSAVMADMFVIAEGALRPHAGAGASLLPDRLTAAFVAELARHPAPAHREGGWDGLDQALRLRLAHGQSGPPPSSDAIAAQSGAHIFAHLPLHPDLLRLDEELVVNSVRFRVLAGWQQLRERCDFAAIARELAGENAENAEETPA
ncbi:MAG: hypothetical protein RL477_520 [Pseudomonadota bacterium]|jgi:hypothetical protein